MRIHTDIQMVLADLRREGPQRNGAYRFWRQCWPIKPRTVRPLMDVEGEFATLKGEVYRTKRPRKAQEYWIS